MQKIYYFNADDKILAEGANLFPEDAPDLKFYHCSRCFKKYEHLTTCQKHTGKCILGVKNPIWSENNLEIAKISDNKNKKFVDACSSLAYFSRREQKLDGVLINPRDNFKKDRPVFCLLKNGSLIGYLAYWEKILIDEDNYKFSSLVFWDDYIIKPERNSNYMVKLFDLSISNLKVKLQDILYSWPPSEELIKLLKSKSIEKINAWTNHGWQKDVPIEF